MNALELTLLYLLAAVLGVVGCRMLRLPPMLGYLAVGVVISRTGWLRELRICHNRQYRPVACPRRAFGPGDGKPLKIWRGL